MEEIPKLLTNTLWLPEDLSLKATILTHLVTLLINAKSRKTPQMIANLINLKFMPPLEDTKMSALMETNKNFQMVLSNTVPFLSVLMLMIGKPTLMVSSPTANKNLITVFRWLVTTNPMILLTGLLETPGPLVGELMDIFTLLWDPTNVVSPMKPLFPLMFKSNLPSLISQKLNNDEFNKL